MRRAVLLLVVPLAVFLCLGPVSSRAPVPIKQRNPLRLARTITALNVLALVDREIEFFGLDDPKTSLIEALDQFSKVHRVIFDVNERAFIADGVEDVLKTEIANPNPIPAMKIRFGFVLKKILDRVKSKSGATFLIRSDHIEITTVAAHRAELGIKDPSIPMPPIVNLVADRRPLDECLALLADQSERNIVFDPRVSDFASTAVTACLLNTTIDSALFLLTDMADLSFVRIDNTYYVTSSERATTMRENWQRRRPAVAVVGKIAKTSKIGK